jgi:hypothetical protein
MSDKASAAGWVAQLTIPGSFRFFNVAIGSADKAVDAARKKAGASDDAPMRVVRELSAAEIQTIKLRAGEAKPA